MVKEDAKNNISIDYDDHKILFMMMMLFFEPFVSKLVTNEFVVVSEVIIIRHLPDSSTWNIALE